MMGTITCLNNKDEIRLKVDCDGPSLPILTIFVKAGSRNTFVCLDKEQTEQLVMQLQILLVEM